MIDQLDNLLRMLLVQAVEGITSPTQVRFQPPDDEWRAAVANLQVDGQPAPALNVYLVDVRENRHLRSTERRRTMVRGVLFDDPGPTRIDCHYLVTAWSPAATAEQVEPTLDEHALLYRALAALKSAVPLTASRILPAGPELDALPPVVRDAALPTSVVPAEGGADLGEFWATMGPGHRWRPALQLTVTLPVAAEPVKAGPRVTATVLTVAGQDGGNGDARSHARLQIGGVVLDTTGAAVPDAWVALETLDGVRLQTVRADELGRFELGPLQAARYRLRVRATGLGETTAELDVPGPGGSYDVRFPQT